MNTMKYAVLLLASATALIACRAHEEVGVRYRMERMLWKAEALERRLDIGAARSSVWEIEPVMQAYRDVAAHAEPAGFNAGAWNSSVAGDIKILAVRANAARAGLAFLADRHFQSGIFYRSTADDPIMYIGGNLRAKERMAHILYGESSCEEMNMESEQVFRQLTGSEDFWSGSLELKDAVFAIPLALLRICGAENDGPRYQEYDDTAEKFYTRIIRVWPDSLVAEKARLHMVYLLMIRTDWNRAVEAIDDMLAHRYGKTIAPRLLILKAFALASGMNDPAGAADVLNEVARLQPASESAYAADLARGFLSIQAGNTEHGMQLLQDIEKNERASDEIRSKAMLLRAVQFERRDAWNESTLILKRIMRFFPVTPAALEAPLVVTRHYVSAGDTAYAVRNLVRAREFYESLFARQNTLFEKGYVVEDYLIENYVLAGRTKAIAAILAEESGSWGRSRCAGALLKSARLYAGILHNEGRSAEILRRCMRQFPETRYARAAERELAAVSQQVLYK